MRLRATDISSKNHVGLLWPSVVMSGQLGGRGTIQQPDESARVRSHKSCRQLPVGILLRFENGFDNLGLCRRR